MKTEKTIPSRARGDIEPVATLAGLASTAASTSSFSGWGPRMSSSVRIVLRGLN